MKIKLLLILLLVSVQVAFSQAPCTDEAAYQTAGRWRTQAEDDLAMADPTFAKTQFQAILPKAQKALELIQKANPTLKGIEARAYRSVRGSSYVSGGAVRFAATVGFFGYYCVPDTPSYPTRRGKVFLGDETGTWIEVFFNDLGWLVNEKKSLGKEFLTAEGKMIYSFPKQSGEVKGFVLLEPDLFREKSEAVLILPAGRTPFKILSREQFLRARTLLYEKEIKKLESLPQAAKIATEYREDVAKINEMLAEMPPGERQSPAVVSNLLARPGRQKIFVEEAVGGRRLATIDRSFFDPNLPRHAVQFITVYWRWDEKNPAKAALIRQFKENFDFQSLKQMLGK